MGLRDKIQNIADELPPLTKEETQNVINKSKEALMWVGIVSIIMLFAGLTSAYFVRKGEGNWQVFDLPIVFYFSTAVILLSSISMNWAVSSSKKNESKNLKIALFITLLLGLAFAELQFTAYRELVSHGLYFSGKNASSSYLYVLSGAHLAHMAGGLLAMFFMFQKAMRNKYNANNSHGIFIASIYWHFLGVLWLFLFLFLIFFR